MEVGNKVEVIQNSSAYKGDKGIVTEIKDRFNVKIELENYNNRELKFRDDELQIIDNL